MESSGQPMTGQQKIALSIDELHPYVHGHEGGTVVHAPAEQVARWRQVMADFEDVQDEMLTALTEAEARDAKDAEVRVAEEAVQQAQARLDAVRWEAEHLAHDPASWTRLGADGTAPCGGLPTYPNEDAAWQGRVHQYDRVPIGESMPFDLAAYLCHTGHWHLGRTS